LKAMRVILFMVVFAAIGLVTPLTLVYAVCPFSCTGDAVLISMWITTVTFPFGGALLALRSGSRPPRRVLFLLQGVLGAVLLGVVAAIPINVFFAESFLERVDAHLAVSLALWLGVLVLGVALGNRRYARSVASAADL
jgi:hypothetical protein